MYVNVFFLKARPTRWIFSVSLRFIIFIPPLTTRDIKRIYKLHLNNKQCRWNGLQYKLKIQLYNTMNVSFKTLIKTSKNFRDTNRKKYGTKEITIPKISNAKLKDYIKKIGES